MKRIFALFLAMMCVFVHAKTHSQFASQYTSRVWNTVDGLAGNTITDILQDSDGYIFLGTYEGLVRFDGIEFVLLNQSKSPDFSFASARSLFEDSNGQLWVGSNDQGITVLSKNSQHIKKFTTKDGLPSNSIRSMCEDNNGNVWVGTSSGLACISSDWTVFEPKGIDVIPGGNTHITLHIFKDSFGRLWISTGDEGVFFYENESFNRFVGLKSFKNLDITTVSQGIDGAMWFGCAPHYAVKFDKSGEQIYDIGFGAQKGSVVNSILQDRDGNVWFALDNGVSVLSEGELFGFDETSELTDDKVTKIMQDREGNIWLATDRGGAQRFSRARFKAFHTKNTVNAIVEDLTRNCVWFAADDGLLCWKNGSFVETKETEFVKKMRVRHVGVTKNGGLLVSTYEQLGQILFDADGTIHQWTKDDGLPGMRVRVAIENRAGDLYIGTTTGLAIFKADGKKIKIRKEDGIPNEYIMALHEDEQGRIWVGTDGGGIFIVKNEIVEKIITTKEGLAGNIVFKIDEVRPNEIWVNTGTGVSIFRPNGKIDNYNAYHGLGSDSTFQAIESNDAKIWFTSNRGLFSVPSKEFDSPPAQNLLTSKWYGRSDGIITSGITSTSLSMRDSSGNLWFTLIDGFLLRNATNKSEKPSPPIVHIEEIKIGERTVRLDGSPVIIYPGENRVNIKFSGLSYSAPEQVRYKTFLRGFDSDYTNWNSSRTVSYTNLAPKKYYFTVIAQGGDESVSPPSETCIIDVRPAFYQLSWFWFVSISAFALLFFLILRGRLNMIKRQQEFLESQIHERTESLLSLQRDLEKKVEERTAELKREKERVDLISVEVVGALASTIDAKDKYTNGHSRRVAEYSKMLAKALGKDEEYQSNIYYIALLHDIGKIGIPDTIINKPGKLTDEEFRTIQQHPEFGFKILKSITTMPEVSVGARWHHERYDGRGYPDHLAGEQIPEIARIICVADSYDAMTSNRSYRKYLPQAVVREEIVKGRGTQFDPIIADKMIELIDADKNYKMHE